MLASAKADLLRKEDYSNFYTHHSPHNPGSGLGTGQMWGQSPTSPQTGSGFDNVGSLAGALRRAGRSDSVSSNGESHLLSGGAYIAPVPTYAVSHNAEIPEGYVPHARDNCCDIDYQWDSMRGVLDWGDGGSYGEEWTAMHHRFRKGLQKLVDWYTTAEQPTDMVTKERRKSVTDYDECAIEDEDEDSEIESVVIMVSHGAGCNALIGAITHQPVLTDVGLASLTQAIRKTEKDHEIGMNRAVTVSSTHTGPPGLVAIHQHYDLKLFASTEHLAATRSGSISLQSRGRPSNGVASSPLSGILANDGFTSRRSSATGNLASMRRDSGTSSSAAGRIALNTSGLNGGGITVGSGVTRFIQRTPTTSSAAGGLWSPLRNNLETPDEDDDNFLPNFSSFDIVTPRTKAEEAASAGAAAAAAASTPVTKGDENGTGGERAGSRVSPRASPAFESSEHEEEDNDVPALPQRGSGMGGLWGSPKPLTEGGIPRDLTPHKRRWTVNERWQWG